MTPSLIHRPDEPATDRTDIEQFPYGNGSVGLPLPRFVARGVLRPTEESGAIGAAGSLSCPNCEGETINGSGLFTCPDCSWTGTLR